MIDPTDTQGIILYSLKIKDSAQYVFCQFDQTKTHEAKQFLSEKMAHLFIASEELQNDNQYRITVAFSDLGLKKLLGKNEKTYGFEPNFVEGLHKRAHLWGETFDYWEWGHEGKYDMLIIFYTKKALMEKQWPLFKEECESSGIDIRHSIEGYIPKGNNFTDHFGFRDGISQPKIEGFHHKSEKYNLCKPGEFILGHINEKNAYNDSPFITGEKSSDAEKYLAIDPHNNHYNLGLNGSYLAIMQFKQEVEKFEEENQDPLDAAKIIGRWKSGAPLTLAHEEDDHRLKRENDFTYDGDQYGFKCPLGSHIRRSNPREFTDKTKNLSDSLKERKIINNHRILRRGRLYNRGNQEKGIIFVAINASIEQQFEFIMRQWLSNGTFNNLSGEKDPLGITGNTPSFNVQQSSADEKRELSRYVYSKGGSYFFLPGKKALTYIFS